MSLSDFRFMSKIGEGAYSTVHKVKRVSDDKIYALKQIKMSNLKEKQKQNALNEVRLLASISSDYIIKYKESFFDSPSNTLCIIIEYAENGDLEKLIMQKKAKLQWIQQEQIWKIFKDIVMGLNTLHQKSIIHRDLKSANIFITKGVYKIADLNVSKLMKNSLAYTQTGTPYYASPQVWQDKPYELKSDIWSLGCIIFEACALKPPFTATNMEGLYKKVLKGVYPKLPLTYSQRLQSIIGKCLEVNPSKRISCKQLLTLLFNEKSERNLNEKQNQSEINLLNTIKIPRNVRNWKSDLPKANYETEKFNNGSDTDLSQKNQKMFNRISYEKLRQIVKTKQDQKNGLVKKISRKHFNPQVQELHQNYGKIYTQNDAYEKKVENILNDKKHSEIGLLPRIKLHSQITDYEQKKPKKVQEILSRLRQIDSKKYEYNRPVWWG